MSVIIKDMELPKTCSQCEIWSKCWDERPFWFERLECCPLTEKADRKTENSSEKPNNCEPQTETEMERLERIDNELEDAWARIRELTDEPQTDDLQDWKDRMWAEAIVTEQTERSSNAE